MADVLENGPSSPFAQFFDIDWDPPKADLKNKVLLPMLGDQYGKVLENQEIKIAYERGTFMLEVYNFTLPVAPRTWTLLLEPALEKDGATAHFLGCGPPPRGALS